MHRNDATRIGPPTLWLVLGCLFLAAQGLFAQPMQPDWVVVGDQATAAFGSAATTCGDINADGYSDLVVGAPSYDGGIGSVGKVFVYYGSAAGADTIPDWSAVGDQVSAKFGISVSAAGDLNGDGFDDLLVGASEYSGSGTQGGAAFVFYGSWAGLGPPGTPSNADWKSFGGQTGAQLGWSVTFCGDVNGDGFGDFAVGEPSNDNSLGHEGRVLVYYGSSAGPATPTILENTSTQADFGYSISAAEDVNGDSFPDLIVGALGRVTVYLGAISGLQVGESWSATGDQPGSAFGASVSTAGDVNGDGYADVLIGAPLAYVSEAFEGRAFAYHGSSSGLGEPGTPSNADWSAESDQSQAQLGWAVRSAGDVNGDGYGDIVLGAKVYDGTGATFLYLGGSLGLGAVGRPSNADGVAFGGVLGEYFGGSLSGAGDVNADGFSEIIVGSVGTPSRASMYLGEALAPAPAPSWIVDGTGEFSTGYVVASAGDVNGDGFSDAVVASPYYSTSPNVQGRVDVYYGSASGLPPSPSWSAVGDRQYKIFGISAGTAGDVNGDGYTDIIIGEIPCCGGGLGRAYAYLGSSTGLGPQGSTGNADWSSGGTIEGTLTGLFGYSVAGAGDVNGDGYGDMIIGAPTTVRGIYASEGAAFIYLGGPAGPDTIPDWTRYGNLDLAGYGQSVASAGDVNGDGKSDVIVGTPSYAQAGQYGAAFVYLGAASGPDTTIAWFATSDQFGAKFGYAVSTAGDLNGDCYSDIVIGAPQHTGSYIQEGGAFVYFGSVGGLGPNGLPSNADWAALGGQPDSWFGVSVAPAGDINADRYGDLMVGSYRWDGDLGDEGRALVFLGGAAGPSTTARWIVEGDQAPHGPYPGVPSNFGQSVASAGDVNGDGYPDPMVGAPSFEVNGLQVGRTFLYVGNSASGVIRNPSQVQVGAPVPVGPLGSSDAEDAIKLRIRASSPMGRSRLRLRWDVLPLPNSPEVEHIAAGPWWDTGAPVPGGGSSVVTDQVVQPLSPASHYRWRVRLEGKSPMAPRSPWWSPVFNSPTEPDFRTLGVVTSVGGTLDGPAPAIEVTRVNPNPFRGVAALGYRIAAAGRVRVTVFDVHGRLVAKLMDSPKPEGAHFLSWDGTSQRGVHTTAGIYFLRIEYWSGNSREVTTRRVALLR